MSPGRRREGPGRSFQAAAAPYYGRSWRKRGYWRLPSSLRSGSTRARQERTFRSSRSWRRAGRDRICGRSTGSRGSSTTSGTRRRAIAALCSTSWSASSMARRGQRSCAGCTRRSPRADCTYSADPVGRLVLGIYGQAGEPELVAMSDSVCTGLQLVNFLQDPPRDLALGRVYLPQESLRRFGVTDADLGGPLTERVAALLRFEAERARGLLEAGLPLARALGGRPGRSVALYARGGLAALDALERAGWDVFSSRPAPTRWAFARLAVRELLRR